MGLALKLHPESLCVAVTGVDVDVARQHDGSLTLSYIVTGKIADLRLPPVTAPARADELWRSTCFEAFIRTAPGEAYYEFNFAPSTQWTAYRFDGYRTGMRVASEIAAPRIEVQSAPECYTLRATLDLSSLPTLSLPSPARGGGEGRGIAARPLGGDRRNQRPEIILGVGASAGQGGFPSRRLLCT